jgi:large-conductance mechanosensitive channel
MDQTGKTFTSEGPDSRKWIGRIIIAVILGEAIWTLIVSVMNNLVVPWLGDVMGQSSGLPASFTQRPYDYPDLFVSILEFGIAATIAAILNYFFQRQRAIIVKPVKSPVPAEPARVVPRAVKVANTQGAPAVALPAPVTKPGPVAPAPPIKVAPAAPAPFVSQPRPVAVAPPAPPVANPPATKPLPTAPKAEAPKVKKPKEAYYNIVGEPVPSDDD